MTFEGTKILIFSAIFFYSTFLYEMTEISKTSTSLKMKRDRRREQVSVFLPEKNGNGNGYVQSTKAVEIARINL